jgi:hypothetical protein
MIQEKNESAENDNTYRKNPQNSRNADRGYRMRGFLKIVSGGQTGVDRAALDIALELGIPCGGWCPKGRIAEDGPIDPIYPLIETDSPGYFERTEKNVVDSDGTLVLNRGPLNGGTALTIEYLEKHRKPYRVIDMGNGTHPQEVILWLRSQRVQVLNVAGPRESKCPGIYQDSKVFLSRSLGSGVIASNRFSRNAPEGVLDLI